eukprot:SM000022S07121  [mRNA]  locus=s22:18631:21150:+ [translate_table: standard]
MPPPPPHGVGAAAGAACQDLPQLMDSYSAALLASQLTTLPPLPAIHHGHGHGHGHARAATLQELALPTASTVADPHPPRLPLSPAHPALLPSTGSSADVQQSAATWTDLPYAQEASVQAGHEQGAHFAHVSDYVPWELGQHLPAPGRDLPALASRAASYMPVAGSQPQGHVPAGGFLQSAGRAAGSWIGHEELHFAAPHAAAAIKEEASSLSGSASGNKRRLPQLQLPEQTREDELDTPLSGSVISRPGSGRTRVHIMAERKRREQLNEKFIGLSLLLPSVSKMDKASVLSDAIRYVKDLQDRLTSLEQLEQATKAAQAAADNPSSIARMDFLSSPHPPALSDIGGLVDAAAEAAGSRASLIRRVDISIIGHSMTVRVQSPRQWGAFQKVVAVAEGVPGSSTLHASMHPILDGWVEMTLSLQLQDATQVNGHLVLAEIQAVLAGHC